MRTLHLTYAAVVPQLLRSSENDRIEGQASMIGSTVPGDAVSMQCLAGGSPMPGLEVSSSPRSFSELWRSWGNHRNISKMNYKHRTSFPGSTGGLHGSRGAPDGRIGA